MKNTQRVVAMVLFVSVIVLAAQSLPAQEGIKRTDVQTANLSVPGREVVQQMVEFQPGVVVAKHTHPGEEVGAVLEGMLQLEVAGKPTVTLKAGQGFVVPPNTPHSAKNTNNGVSRLLATYIVEKGKPLRSPAP
jgi:quercetin dioxygenase-like cupin family protein